jgi:TP901-1 family phage major tail protein
MVLTRTRLLERIIAPASEPVALSLAKHFLRVEHSADDSLISQLIVAARQMVDTTNKDSGGWRLLLAGAGIRSITLSGSGIFTDSASEETVRGYAFTNSINNYEFYFGGNDKISGAFQITSYERAGNHDGEETYAITFESAGAITSTIV